MKSSLIASGLVVATLIQSVPAHTQVFDLPEPGMEGTPSVKAPNATAVPVGQYAGSLRLGPVSRQSDGSNFRIILDQATRLVRLDLRMTFGKARVREAWLVTESGVKIEVGAFRATGILEESSINSSENFSLNENISEILISTEAFSENAEVFVTAIGENLIPRLALFQPPQNTEQPGYTPAPGGVVRSEECVKDFCVNDVVIFRRQRAKILKVSADGRILIMQRGIRKVVSASELMKPSIPPYRG